MRSKIAVLNDHCRQSTPHANCYLTRGLLEAFNGNITTILLAIRNFDQFTPDNDPYGEHDFGAVTVEGHRIFWKIDTFSDNTLTMGAEDPLSPQAVRVITIMLAEDY